ncbi:MAG TPA: FAD binding domain-containing protein, partial [Polyangiaceae bacterium]|nr:FAD binding domain-containing protein [Polyangiaceae bacterium]
ALPFPASDDPWLETLRAAVPSLASPSPPSPRFERPGSLEGVFARLAASPGAVLIAGGTDLMVYANQRYERWPALVSLEGVPELRDFTVEDGAMVIGAGVPLAAIEERLRGTGAAPALEALLPLFSSRLIRNRATLGGSLVTASPIGDAAPVLLALDADVVIASAAGMRRLPLTDFFVGYRKTVLAPGDVVVSVHLPLPAPRHQRFYKVSKRVMDDISTVAAAFALDLDGEGRVARLRAAFGGVAATPVRALDAERAAVGRRWDAETIAALGPALDALGTPMTDHRGSAAYRRAMPRRLLERFFFEVKTAEAPAGEARP